FLFMPGKDRADGERVCLAVDLDASGPVDALTRRLRQLGLEPLARKGLAPKAAAAVGTTAQRQVHAWIAELGKDGLFDLIELERPIVDLTVADVEVQDLVELPVAYIAHLRAGRCGERERRDHDQRRASNDERHLIRNYTRCSRNPASASLNAFGVSMFGRCPA